MDKLKKRWQNPALLLKLLLGIGVSLSLVNCSSHLPKPYPLQNLDQQVNIQLGWRTDFNGQKSDAPIALTPSLVKGVLTVVSSGGQVVALNSKTGALIWQISLPSPVTAGIGQHNDYLLVATQDGQLHALNANDGRPLWQIATTSEVLAKPQVKGNLVILQTIDGRLTTYNLSDGQEVWSFASRLPSLTLRGGSAPLIDGLVVYAGFANGKLIALDINTGEPIWQQSLGLAVDQDIDRLVDVDSSLHLVDGLLYASSFQGDLVAVNALSGQVVWRQPANRIRSITVNNKHVYALTQKGTVHAYSSPTGELIWDNDALLHRGISSIHQQKNWLVLFDQLEYMHVLDASTGDLVGRMRTQQSQASVGALVSDRSLYAITNKDTVLKLILTSQ